MQQLINVAHFIKYNIYLLYKSNIYSAILNKSKVGTPEDLDLVLAKAEEVIAALDKQK